MLRVQCNQCGQSAYTDNTVTPDDALVCPCCPEGHQHGLSANTCHGEHPEAECTHPDPLACNVVSEQGSPCPGEHCGLGVSDCMVCRPVTITVLATPLLGG